MKIIKKDTFRSTALVNMTDDLLRVTLEMPMRDYPKFLKFVQKSCHVCRGIKKGTTKFFPECPNCRRNLKREKK